MFISADKNRCFNDYILIYPAVSVGNVAQLSADLLISTLSLHKAGYIQHPSIIPLVGGDPYAQPGETECKIFTCCEVYVSEEHKIVILQQRAPFVQGRCGEYRKWLVQWIKENKFKRVVIATSSWADERIDKQIHGSQFRFLASSQIEDSTIQLFRDQYHWQQLERRQSFPAPSVLQLQDEETSGELYIPGGGIAKSLFEDLSTHMPVMIFLMFCAEGDNIPEATELANCLNRWLNLIHNNSVIATDTSDITKWKIPISWKLFFGSNVDQILYH